MACFGAVFQAAVSGLNIKLSQLSMRTLEAMTNAPQPYSPTDVFKQVQARTRPAAVLQDSLQSFGVAEIEASSGLEGFGSGRH